MSPAELRAARKSLGLSQRGVAEFLKLGANGARSVRRWEAGDRSIDERSAMLIEAALSSPALRKSLGIDALARRYRFERAGRAPG